MGTIERTSAFRRDFKREKRGQHRHDLELLVSSIVSLLAGDEPLPERNRDHALGADWQDCRECHLRPDLLMIYRKPASEVLQLVRLGSHSELFGRGHPAGARHSPL
jgi:mRNA interferase YafQ